MSLRLGAFFAWRVDFRQAHQLRPGVNSQRPEDCCDMQVDETRFDAELPTDVFIPFPEPKQSIDPALNWSQIATIPVVGWLFRWVSRVIHWIVSPERRPRARSRAKQFNRPAADSFSVPDRPGKLA
jgi:hypothetical protein